MSGAGLERFRKNPVVLDTHNRSEIGAIIGTADVSVEDRVLVATVRFAQTERAEIAWQLYRDGFGRAASIGFWEDQTQTRMLKAGETDGDGDGRITGPAWVIRAWELFELSLVPVPGDADALKRYYYQAMDRPCGGDQYKEGAIMPENDEEVSAENRAEEGDAILLKDIAAEVKAREVVARHAEIRSYFDGQYQDLCRDCIVGNFSVDDSVAKLRAAMMEKSKAIGTPEPPPIERAGKKETVDALDNRSFAQSIGAL